MPLYLKGYIKDSSHETRDIETINCDSKRQLKIHAHQESISDLKTPPHQHSAEHLPLKTLGHYTKHFMASSIPNQNSSQEKIDMEGESNQERHLSDNDDAEKATPSVSAVFPEGGAKAWSVAAGATLVLFSTLGYVNSFGYDCIRTSRDRLLIAISQSLPNLLRTKPAEDYEPFDHFLDWLIAGLLSLLWNASWRPIV